MYRRIVCQLSGGERVKSIKGMGVTLFLKGTIQCEKIN